MATKSKRSNERKMEGLSLPDVVRQLLKEPEILRWDGNEGVYEVLDGENFELRFNELRRVRNKEKTGGERPFSRMHNFFALSSGDKWARTGTKFRPINQKGYPDGSIRGLSQGHCVHNPSINLLSSHCFSSLTPSLHPMQVTGLGMANLSSVPVPVEVRIETTNKMSSISAPNSSFAGDFCLPASKMGISSEKSLLGKRPARYFKDDSDCDDIAPPHVIDSFARNVVHKRPRLSYYGWEGFGAPEFSSYPSQISSNHDDRFWTSESRCHSQHHLKGPSLAESPPPSGSRRRPSEAYPMHFFGVLDQFGRSQCSLGSKSSISDLNRRLDPSVEMLTSSPAEQKLSLVGHRSVAWKRRADSWSDEDVIEVSSQGGSCQPSPEGPVLSLCDDDMAPLDLGDPALISAGLLQSHSMSESGGALMATVGDTGCEAIILELGCASGTRLDCLVGGTCGNCGSAGGSCMGSCVGSPASGSIALDLSEDLDVAAGWEAGKVQEDALWIGWGSEVAPF